MFDRIRYSKRVFWVVKGAWSFVNSIHLSSSLQLVNITIFRDLAGEKDNVTSYLGVYTLS